MATHGIVRIKNPLCLSKKVRFYVLNKMRCNNLLILWLSLNLIEGRNRYRY